VQQAMIPRPRGECFSQQIRWWARSWSSQVFRPPYSTNAYVSCLHRSARIGQERDKCQASMLPSPRCDWSSRPNPSAIYRRSRAPTPVTRPAGPGRSFRDAQQTGERTGRGAGKNAGRDVEMVEAVGIEPTSGCPGPEASTRVVDPLNLGPQGSDRQDPSRPSQALVSPATRPTDVPASPCVDVRSRSTGLPGRT